MTGKENPYKLHEELAQVMLRDCTIERHNDVLDKVHREDRRARGALARRRRHRHVARARTRARSSCVTSGNMLVLARVIAQGARNRDESRGAHFKPDFKRATTQNLLRTTMALYERRDERQERRELRARRSTTRCSARPCT